MIKRRSPLFTWSVVATIAYVILNAIAIYVLQPDFERVFANISWLQLIILGLGVYRLTDIIVYEKVAEPLREFFGGPATRETGDFTRAELKGLRGFFAQLFSCNSCMGVWVATVVLYAFAVFPSSTFVIMLIFALSGAEQMFSKLYNLLERK